MRENKIFLILFSITVISSILFLFFYEKDLKKDDLLPYIEKKITELNSYDLMLETDRDLNDKHIILFSFNQKGINERLYGIAIFNIKSNGRYSFYKYEANSGYTHISPLITKKNSKDIGYSVFYGIITEDIPSNYKIITGGNEFIEKFNINDKFINYYEIIDSNGVQILPLKTQ